MTVLDNGRSLKDELIITRYMDGYSERANYDPPPTLAPEEYTATFVNPITAPVALTTLTSQFGDGGNNLKSLTSALPGVPSSPPIAMSDFIGKSGNYRLNGKVRLDRWDDILGAGLSSDAKNTWDGSDTTYMPPSETAGASGGGWNNAFVNSYPLVLRMENGTGKGKVTAVRNYSFHFRWRQASAPNAAWKMWVNYIEGGSFADLTYEYGDTTLTQGSINAYNLNLVTGGALQAPVKTDVIDAQRWARVYNSIECGCLTRIALTKDRELVPRFADVYVQLDCDIEVR